ncbi:DRTGG domain-containing protein [Sporosalibacterium faouarense]|uniref:DRTGG domain-containing protein n=1 Tax=Sporosalibacterium faouarense TaxID=516123 RepID=UPI00141CDB83|nr:hypothetical protein [Bacillota bacterium]
MKLKSIQETLNAEVLTGKEFLEKEVKAAFGCDLMSDVLAFVKEDTILLTGLVNPQVIRTAEMIDVYAIVFVRGKKPSQQVLDMAKERDILLMTTDHILYNACGILYSHGLKGLDLEEGAIV